VTAGQLLIYSILRKTEKFIEKLAMEEFIEKVIEKD
jgi:hypothetical protein